MSNCGVDFRDGNLIVTLNRWSTEDFMLNVFFSKAPSLEPLDVGHEVRRALTAAATETESAWASHELRAQVQKRYEAAGARGWSDFVNSASHASVEEEGHDVRVVPSRNAGAGEGFVLFEEDQWLIVSDPSIEELGAVVLEALRRSGATF